MTDVLQLNSLVHIKKIATHVTGHPEGWRIEPAWHALGQSHTTRKERLIGIGAELVCNSN